MPKTKRVKPSDAPAPPPAALLRLAEAARLLSISASTLKQWIYHGRLASVRTPGGHHRIPASEIARVSREPLPPSSALEGVLGSISGRNKLLGRVVKVRYGGILAEVTLDIGGQELTSVITSTSCRSLGLEAGVPAYALIKATEVMVIRA